MPRLNLTAMDKISDHDGKSKTASAVDEDHYPEMEAQESESHSPTHEEIAALAHQLWIKRGSPIGSPERDWLEAEGELSFERHDARMQIQHLHNNSGSVQS